MSNIPHFHEKLYFNFMAPFYFGWGSTASRLQPLRGGSLLFTIQQNDIKKANDIKITCFQSMYLVKRSMKSL